MVAFALGNMLRASAEVSPIKPVSKEGGVGTTVTRLIRRLLRRVVARATFSLPTPTDRTDSRHFDFPLGLVVLPVSKSTYPTST